MAYDSSQENQTESLAGDGKNQINGIRRGIEAHREIGFFHFSIPSKYCKF